MEYSVKPKRLEKRRIIHYPQKRIIGLYVKKMGYRNSEGYSDPTAGRAISKADRMPTHIYNAYKILNEVAGLMGLEVTAVRDRRTKQEWKR